MKMSEAIINTPWDERALGVKTYEIRILSADVIEEIRHMPGHFTVRVDPLSSKKILHDNGFYYCDTLVEPFCTPDRFIAFKNPSAGVSRAVSQAELSGLAYDVYFYGRFHRDFQIKSELADRRYSLWLEDLYNAGNVWGLMYKDVLAGFFGLDENRIVLNAVGRKYQGKGLAKFLWSAGCAELFRTGHDEIMSSISVANVAILNVYSALGFRFRNPLDIYHRLNG